MLVDEDESASTLEPGESARVLGAESDSEREAAAWFEGILAVAWNPKDWRDTNIVLAVSGGADSVALLRAVASLKAQNGGIGSVTVAHLNHQLRVESKDDAAWLAKLCSRVSLPLEIGLADVASHTAKLGDGLEAAARDARYEFLRQTAARLGARFVVTAHTANDQAETVLHRIVRGTGLAGLAGIPNSRRLSESVTLIRPMLLMTRSDVLGYLDALDQDYVTDASNSDMAFTRNRVRHELLPELREKFNPAVDAALVRIATQASETQQALEMLAERIGRECIFIGRRQRTAVGRGDETSKADIRIDCPLVCDQPEVLIREVCKLAWREIQWPMQAMGFREWQVLADLVVGRRTTANLPGNVLARREGEWLLLERSSLS